MRSTTSLIASVLAATLAPAAHAADVEVALTGIRAHTGVVKVALVDGPAGWDGKAKPVRATGAPATGGTATFAFDGLAPGRYAVMVTHDENGNGSLDTNLIGMPVEGYGFSNNPRVMRKPTFEEAAFTVGADDVRVAIELR